MGKVCENCGADMNLGKSGLIAVPEQPQDAKKKTGAKMGKFAGEKDS